jgi:PTS HPr component phosphorylation site.
VTIELKTIQDVKDFVEVSRKYHDCEIVVKQGRYIVDGKSILGIFSLNLLEPVRVIIDSKNDNLKIAFYNNIEKWKKENYEEITD